MERLISILEKLWGIVDKIIDRLEIQESDNNVTIIRLNQLENRIRLLEKKETIRVKDRE